MYPTKDFFFNQSKFFSCGKLPFAGEAGKACQVIHIPLGSSDPVSRMDVPATARATGSIPSKNNKKMEYITESTQFNCHSGELWHSYLIDYIYLEYIVKSSCVIEFALISIDIMREGEGNLLLCLSHANSLCLPKMLRE